MDVSTEVLLSNRLHQESFVQDELVKSKRSGFQAAPHKLGHLACLVFLVSLFLSVNSNVCTCSISNFKKFKLMFQGILSFRMLTR